MGSPSRPTVATRSRLRRLAGSMTRAEWRRMAGMAAFIAALHVIGWFTLVWIVTPEHYTLGEKTFGIGIGVAAHALGMRHAFDADHIADAVTAVPGGAAPGTVRGPGPHGWP
ncbi:hypothetical protein [Streptomyces sp. NBC_01383]|uniref:hypothetical protein n=1 Tax=Streptomyces sp. NBC_01383 TaxID=2903846 RepID=UPI003870C544